MSESSSTRATESAVAKKRKSADDNDDDDDGATARRRCTKKWCAHADPTQGYASTDDCSGSDSDADSNGFMRQHCVACRQLCWDNVALMCSKCDAIVCPFCRDDNLYTAESPNCYMCARRGSTQHHCFQCVIQTPVLWCRNASCTTVYNVSALLIKVYGRGLAKNVIPDNSNAVALERINDSAFCSGLVGTREIEELSTRELKRILHQLNKTPRYRSKEALRNYVNEALKEEQKFKKDYEARTLK